MIFSFLWLAGGKNENEELGGENGKNNGGRLHKKTGTKGLKNASFWVINSAPIRRKLIRRGKKLISKEGGG